METFTGILFELVIILELIFGLIWGIGIIAGIIFVSINIHKCKCSFKAFLAILPLIITGGILIIIIIIFFVFPFLFYRELLRDKKYRVHKRMKNLFIIY